MLRLFGGDSMFHFLVPGNGCAPRCNSNGCGFQMGNGLLLWIPKDGCASR